MATNTLLNISSEARDAGWSLCKRLKNTGFPFTALFWAEFDEDDWLIFLATPLVDQQGTPKTCERLREVMNQLNVEEQGAVNLFDVALVRPTARIVEETMARYDVVAGDPHIVRRISLSSDAAYVYELQPSEQAMELAGTAG